MDHILNRSICKYTLFCQTVTFFPLQLHTRCSSIHFSINWSNIKARANLLFFFRHFQVKRKWSEQEENEGAFGTFVQPSFNLCSTIIVAVRENSISIPLFYQGIDNLIRIVFLLNKLSQKFSRKKVKQIANKCPFDLVLNCKAIL